MASITDMAKATAPRTFGADPSLTIDALYEKLTSRAAAFPVEFERKGGIGGERIAFQRDPKLDVALNVTVKDGRITALSVSDDTKQNLFSAQEDVDAFLQSIIDNQSLDVDVISGATTESQALVGAITNALKQ